MRPSLLRPSVAVAALLVAAAAVLGAGPASAENAEPVVPTSAPAPTATAIPMPAATPTATATPAADACTDSTGPLSTTGTWTVVPGYQGFEIAADGVTFDPCYPDSSMWVFYSLPGGGRFGNEHAITVGQDEVVDGSYRHWEPVDNPSGEPIEVTLDGTWSGENSSTGDSAGVEVLDATFTIVPSAAGACYAATSPIALHGAITSSIDGGVYSLTVPGYEILPCLDHVTFSVQSEHWGIPTPLSSTDSTQAPGEPVTFSGPIEPNQDSIRLSVSGFAADGTEGNDHLLATLDPYSGALTIAEGTPTNIPIATPAPSATATPAPSVLPASASAARSLANTGLSAQSPLELGAVALVAGVSLLLLAARRRRA
ncbi:hypothetical protein HQQ81_13810 [Microbacteriaceae bacterium VKM Ac-2854]|nr:hypothetical protein [Microbacteriaceae bacterium VKM Ac-2854]